MPQLPDIKLFNKGMNKDTDPRFLGQGEYIDALNIMTSNYQDGAALSVTNFPSINRLSTLGYTRMNMKISFMCSLQMALLEGFIATHFRPILWQPSLQQQCFLGLPTPSSRRRTLQRVLYSGLMALERSVCMIRIFHMGHLQPICLLWRKCVLYLSLS